MPDILHSVPLDQILEATPFPTLVVDDEGRIEYPNVAATNISA